MNRSACALFIVASVTVFWHTTVFAHSYNPLNDMELYIDPNSHATEQISVWGDTEVDNSARLERIANQPTGHWFGNWNSAVRHDVHDLVSAAHDTGKAPVLVLYNIPYRDCGSYSAGGSDSAEGYKTFVHKFAKGIGNAPAIVIVEPDALGVVDCLSPEQKQERFNLLSYAVKKIKKQPHAIVYIDAGHSNWVKAKTMAKRLKKSGIASADGFALNVSNFYTTEDNTTYGARISKRTHHSHFVIDTSRNGNGPSVPYEWCNPSGVALGTNPTTDTGVKHLDALLWIKPPGESDGTCNGGPSAGTWWLEYALDLSTDTQ